MILIPPDAVRKMRDRIYCVQISDNEWEKCKHNWLKPEETEWLRAQIEKHPNDAAPSF